MKDIKNILQTNIYDPRLKVKFLLIGSCLPNIHPEILGKFANDWENIFTFCLEEFHYNQLHAKLSAILGVGNTKEVGFLTVDGSPHCIQMHYVSKYLKRELNNDITFKHYVISKDKKVYEVDMKAIDEAKSLAKFGKEV